MSGSSVGTYIRDGSCITMDSSEVSRVSVFLSPPGHPVRLGVVPHGKAPARAVLPMVNIRPRSPTKIFLPAAN